jgi:hypothetical protein
MDVFLLTASVLLGHITGAATARLRGPRLLGLALVPLTGTCLLLPSPWGPVLAGLTTLTAALLAALEARRPPTDDALSQGHALILAFLILLCIALLGAAGGLPAPLFAALVGGASGLLAGTQAQGEPLPQLAHLPHARGGMRAVGALLSFVLGATLTEGVGLACAALYLITLTLSRTPRVRV